MELTQEMISEIMKQHDIPQNAGIHYHIECSQKGYGDAKGEGFFDYCYDVEEESTSEEETGFILEYFICFRFNRKN